MALAQYMWLSRGERFAMSSKFFLDYFTTRYWESQPVSSFSLADSCFQMTRGLECCVHRRGYALLLQPLRLVGSEHSS
jgi:hypothetical protein